jgi:hypothetical protein
MSFSPDGTPMHIYQTWPLSPCPKDMRIGYGEWNGTIFLVCSKSGDTTDTGSDTALTVGLILGALSLVLLITVFYLLGCSVGRGYCIRGRNTTMRRPSLIMSTTPNCSLVKEALSEEAMNDFLFDILSDRLKQELMIIRVRKARNLNEFSKYARESRANTVAAWIDNMNPGLFPRNLTNGEAKETV